MIVRPVDKDGDMMPISYSEQMVSGNKAVAQIVKQRLLLYFGEWWEDDSLGFRIPQFLADGARAENIQMLAKYIASYVSDTEGVIGVNGASISLRGRSMRFSCFVHTGQDVESVEVNLDGVLSAQY